MLPISTTVRTDDCTSALVERNVRSRRLDAAARIALVALALVIDWRQLLTIVRPDTLVRWHRQGFRLYWRWKSRRPGRPRIPRYLQDVIAAMARANQTWGEERIAAELLLSWASPYRDCPTVHAAAGPVAAAFIVADVAHVRAEPRPRDTGVRFLRGGDGHLPGRVRGPGAGHRHPSNSALGMSLNIRPPRGPQFRSVLTGEEPYRFIVHDRDAVFSPRC